MLWEAYQQGQISQAQSAAARAQSKADRYADDIQRIQRSCERLVIGCQAMWELLRERTDLTDADLEEKILEIDLRDGKADGKISRQVVTCPACGRTSSSLRSQCMICGADTPKQHAFEG